MGVPLELEPVRSMKGVTAPLPRCVEGDKAIWEVGSERGENRDTVPQGRNLEPHSTSDWNSLLRRIRASTWRRVVVTSITLRTNALPGLITFAACWKEPSKESSLFEQDLRSLHSKREFTSLDSLSAGRRSCMSSESISMPSTVSIVAGPSHFSGAIGTPSEVHVYSNIEMYEMQFSVLGFLTSM